MNKNKINIYKFILLIALVLSVLLIAGCGSADYDSGYNSEGYSSDSSITSITDNRKVYYTVRYKVTSKELEKDLASLNSLIKKYNGYADSTDVDTSDDSSSATYVVKIPTTSLDAFMNEFESGNKCTSKSMDSTDITTSYVTTEARIEALEASRTQYLNMLKDDNLTINEITVINDKIDDINTELNALNTQMTKYNNLLEYSTITIYFNQAAKDTFFGDLFENYGPYLLGLLKVVVAIVLYTLPFAFIAGVILLIVLKPFKKKREKKNKLESPDQQ